MKEKIQLALARKIRRWLDMLEQAGERERFARLANSPRNLVIDKPYRLIHPEHITIGDDVYLGPESMLSCVVEYPTAVLNPPEGIEPVKYTPRIVIGNRVSATGGLQIGACQEVVVEDDVLFATNVHMTDGFHGYANVDVPYKFQNMWQIAPIRIGRGSWIGQNVVVSPGVSIGEMCIVGANSVVTEDIPPFSIAVGAPARVIKSWDRTTGSWQQPSPASKAG